jgi:hypothetical protein
MAMAKPPDDKICSGSSTQTSPAAATRAEPEMAVVGSVPVASDGSRFAIELALPDGSFQVGPKGAERRIHGYREALEWLAHEHRAGRGAYWRRPSATSGMRGIVKAVRWIDSNR